MITGSIAAYRCPDLVRDLEEGAEVQVYATREGLRYVSKDALEWCSLNPVIDHFSPDAEHLFDQKPLDAFLVAPASYSVINKTSMGLADSVVTSTLASALGRCEKGRDACFDCSGMHGSMHNSLLKENLKRLDDMGLSSFLPGSPMGRTTLLQQKSLLRKSFAPSSISAERVRMLITGGPTRCPLTGSEESPQNSAADFPSKFQGSWFRGAEVKLILGRGSLQPPSYLDSLEIADFHQYRKSLLDTIEEHQAEWGSSPGGCRLRT